MMANAMAEKHGCECSDVAMYIGPTNGGISGGMHALLLSLCLCRRLTARIDLVFVFFFFLAVIPQAPLHRCSTFSTARLERSLRC